ncbi:MAG: MmgE/PrpD family protein [Chloroflexota bacterium]
MTTDGSVSAAVARLASFVAETSYEDIPANVLERTRLIVADAVGVALASCREPEMGELHFRLPPGGGATVLKAGFPEADPFWAAFANAMAVCFLELDEGFRPTGHPAMHVVPTALAVAQSLGKSGREFLGAVVLGYEVQARIGCGSRFRRPVHPHGSMGNGAAAAAIGKLLGWNEEQIRRGINIATTLAVASPWRPCMLGATVRNVYPGMAVQAAFTTRMLVESGFTADEEALHTTYGELLGEGFDAAPLCDGLGIQYAVLGNYFKFHAACAFTHPVLDSLADALGAVRRRGEYPLLPAPQSRPEPGQIRSVRVHVAERFARLAVKAGDNQLSAKFSIPYAAAAYLVLGTSVPDSFRGAALTDSRIRDVESRVEVVAQRDLTARWPAEWASRVEIELTDGRVLVGSCSNPLGHSQNPIDSADLLAKFRYLTSGILSNGQQNAVWNAALRLDEIEDMRQFPVPR